MPTYISPTSGSQTYVTLNFQNPASKVVLVGFDGIDDFSQLEQSLTQEGDNVRLRLPDGQSVVLLQAGLGQVTEQVILAFSDESLVPVFDSYFDVTVARDVFTGTSGADVAFSDAARGPAQFHGLGGNDRLVGAVTADYLDGGAGDDILSGDDVSGLASNDWLEGGEGNDELEGGGGDDYLRGGSGNDFLFGGGGSDELYGGSGDDRVEGGGGRDTLRGDSGRDLLLGDGGNDVIELDNDLGRANLSESSVQYGAYGGTGADRYVLTLSYGDMAGTFSYADIGGDTILLASNLIADFDAADVLDLQAWRVARSMSDLVIQQSQIGSQIVTTVSASGAHESPYLTLIGVTAAQLTAANFQFFDSPTDFYGDSAQNNMIGNDLANVFHISTNADRMEGRGGDDRYEVDNEDDVVIELAGGGRDLVWSMADSYVLPANVEDLELFMFGSSFGMEGIGNALDNVITGSYYSGSRLYGMEGNDRLIGNGMLSMTDGDLLDGGAGNDVMEGHAYTTTYVVDSVGDVIASLGGGQDTVQAGISYTLGADLEHLELTGSANLNGTGNGLANRVIGNGGNNVLMGVGGNDYMVGGMGNDTLNGGADIDRADYDSAAAGVTIDLRITTAQNTGAAGIDTLLNIEDINASRFADTLYGSAVVNQLWGSGGNDFISAMAGNDSIDGSVGNDVLNGGTGNDRMTGGIGADIFLFNTALNASTNKDTIVDFNPVNDIIRLDDDIFLGLGFVGAPTGGGWFRAGTAAGDSNDRIIYNAGTRTLYYDPDGTGSAGKVAFAIFDEALTITYQDFFVVD